MNGKEAAWKDLEKEALADINEDAKNFRSPIRWWRQYAVFQTECGCLDSPTMLCRFQIMHPTRANRMLNQM